MFRLWVGCFGLGPAAASAPSSDSGLPSGWRMEKSQRGSGPSVGIMDKYCISPEVFRSMVDVGKFRAKKKMKK